MWQNIDISIVFDMEDAENVYENGESQRIEEIEMERKKKNKETVV
jgi:hypothetical protein